MVGKKKKKSPILRGLGWPWIVTSDGFNTKTICFPATQPTPIQPEESLLDATGTKLYQAMVGSMVYLTQCTRYAMCYAVNQLTRACTKPAQTHMRPAKHAQRYLKGHPDLPIIYKRGRFRMQGFTNASFASNPGSGKSTTGSNFSLRGGPISFGAKTQSLTAQSVVEAELMAISYTTKEAVDLSNFMAELHFENFSNVPISSGNTGALLQIRHTHPGRNISRSASSLSGSSSRKKESPSIDPDYRAPEEVRQRWFVVPLRTKPASVRLKYLEFV